MKLFITLNVYLIVFVACVIIYSQIANTIKIIHPGKRFFFIKQNSLLQHKKILNQDELNLFYDLLVNPGNYSNFPNHPTPRVLSSIDKVYNGYRFSILYHNKWKTLYISKNRYILYIKISKYFQSWLHE